MNTDQQKILTALDLKGLGVEEQEELLLELGDIVFRGSMIRMIEKMDDGTKAHFEQLMDSEPSEDELSAFLRENVPNADALVQETLQDLRNDILAVTGT